MWDPAPQGTCLSQIVPFAAFTRSFPCLIPRPRKSEIAISQSKCREPVRAIGLRRRLRARSIGDSRPVFWTLLGTFSAANRNVQACPGRWTVEDDSRHEKRFPEPETLQPCPATSVFVPRLTAGSSSGTHNWRGRSRRASLRRRLARRRTTRRPPRARPRRCPSS